MNRPGMILTLTMLIISLAPAATQAQAISPPAGSQSPGVARYESSVLGAFVDNAAVSQTLAQQCMARDSRPEVHAFCQGVATTAQDNIRALTGWLGSWYGNGGYTAHTTAADTASLAAINASNSDHFESLFLGSIIDKNVQAMSVASNYLTRQCDDGSRIGKTHGKVGQGGCGTDLHDNPTLTNFSKSLIATLSAQNDQLRAWRCDWYSKGCD